MRKHRFFCVRGYDPATGRRKVRQLGTCPSKRAALAHRAAVLAGRAGTENETVGQFLERVWLPSKHGRVEVGTFDQYEWAVRRHVVPLLGSSPPRLHRRSGRRVGDGADAAELLGQAGSECDISTPGAQDLSMAMEEAVQRGRLARNAVVLTQPRNRPDEAEVDSRGGPDVSSGGR
ncbi:MAG: hypothetical protein LC799_16185 [Actinobacteria bacterium]|nr:hypothetical protein [Actinomycetota bacterium]